MRHAATPRQQALPRLAGRRTLALTLATGLALSLGAIATPDIHIVEAEAATFQDWPADFTRRALPTATQTLVNPAQPPEARRAAARLLERAGTHARNQVPALLNQLEQINADDRWRISGLFVADIQGDARQANAFLKLSGEHQDPALRLYGVRILSAAGLPGKESAPVMLELAQRDSDKAVRRAALRALEQHAHDREEVIQLFISLLDAADADLRHIAARGLAQAGSAAESAIPALLASLSAEDTYPHVRAQLWRSLLSVGPNDSRVVGPHTLRNPQADAGDTQPGMQQRLTDSFRAKAEATTYQPSTGGQGYRYFSGRGWRGDEEPLPAFPGAQGFGMWTPGGRGGDIIRVTTLANDGPGSLRAAVEAKGPRIVVFDVAGTIHLTGPLNISKPYLTLAGQTAPGDGIAITGHHTQIGTNDVIVRHLRFRPGDVSPPGAKAINVREGDNIILDHISTSWAKEETFSVVHSGRVTVQRSVISHGLVDAGHRKGERGYGSLVRGAGPGNHDYAQGSYYSFINNLWAHQRSRAPRPGNYRHRELDPVGPLYDFRNNVFYNWGGLNAGDNFDTESISRYNFIGNYYQSGVNTDGNFALNDVAPHSQAHWSGNAMNGEIPENPRSLVRGDRGDDYFQLEPFKAGRVRTESAHNAYRRVLAEASAWPRDSYDRQMIEDVRAGAGEMIDSQEEVGGLPVLRPALSARDSNGNGLPDWWQIKHGIAPNAELDPAGDLNGSGYTNIEEYLNGTDMEVFVDYLATLP